MNEQSILHDHIILSHSSLNIYNIYYQANNKFQFGAVLCEWKPSQAKGIKVWVKLLVLTYMCIQYF